MKKKIIIAVAVLVLLLAVGILAWRHTTLLEEIPQDIWDGEVDVFDHINGFIIDEDAQDFTFDYTPLETSGEELREIFSGAQLWRTADPGWAMPEYPHFFLSITAGVHDFGLYVGEDGYILLAHREYPSIEAKEEYSIDFEHTWYWDGGSLYQTMKEMLLTPDAQ